MKYTFLSTVVLASMVSLISCNKREIIPAPEPKVDLETHFVGTIAGSTELDLTENVNGYEGSSDADLIIEASGIDRAVYYSSLKSTSSLIAMTVGHGSVNFDAATSPKPTLTQFNNFFQINVEPPFSSNGTNGFVVIYRDATGKIWQSNEAHIYPAEDVLYSAIQQESDGTGDYNKFVVTFDTYVYNYDNVLMEWDSLLITDATYKGWYRR